MTHKETTGTTAAGQRALAAVIRLRPISDDDLPFLAEVYASTRADELAPVPWSPEAKAAFLRMQFEAQHAHYTTNYAGATLQVIELDGKPAGRLYVARWPAEIRIMDIALLPEHRSRGAGTRLLRDLQEEARAAGVRLSIHVEFFNPAMRLYERLGFRPIGEVGVYRLLEWSPGRD